MNKALKGILIGIAAALATVLAAGIIVTSPIWATALSIASFALETLLGVGILAGAAVAGVVAVGALAVLGPIALGVYVGKLVIDKIKEHREEKRNHGEVKNDYAYVSGSYKDLYTDLNPHLDTPTYNDLFTNLNPQLDTPAHSVDSKDEATNNNVANLVEKHAKKQKHHRHLFHRKSKSDVEVEDVIDAVNKEILNQKAEQFAARMTRR